MTDAPDYGRATNAACKLLLALGKAAIPIHIESIVHALPGVRIKTYSELNKRYGVPYCDMLKRLPSELGFITQGGRSGNSIIFFNDRVEFAVRRFTVCHELGHIVMGHSDDTPAADKEASCFARNLLCPLPLRRELSITQVGDAAEIFHISLPAAKVAAEKTETDFYHVDKALYGELARQLLFSCLAGGWRYEAYYNALREACLRLDGLCACEACGLIIRNAGERLCLSCKYGDVPQEYVPDDNGIDLFFGSDYFC